VVLALVWGAGCKLFRDWGTNLLVMPAAVTLPFYCLWPFNRSVTALGGQIGRATAERRSTAATVIVVVLALCFLRLGPDTQRGELFYLPWWLDWLRPQDKLYRVLLLMPAWGSWAMLITLKFCQPAERTEPQVAALARSCDAIAVAGIMAVLLAVTIVYFQYLGLGGQVAVPLTTVLAGGICGAVFCRVSGGLSRQSLLATNLATQIALLTAYLAAR